MESLTAREYEVADMIHQGYIEKEIASEINVSYETVRTHTKNIRRKLKARNMADVTRIFILQLSKAYRIMIVTFFLSLQIFTMIDNHTEMIRPRASRTVRVQQRKGKGKK